MASSALPQTSASFIQIYDSLPLEAQRTLLETHLAPLLNDLPDAVAAKVSGAAQEMQARFAGMPKLDYLAKRTELEGMLSELEKDQKLSSYIRDRSVRVQLLEEIMDSLSTWVNDIWTVVFEYRTNFRLGHQCLLLAAETVNRMFIPHRGCNCAVVNLYITTKIRRHKTKKIAKIFRVIGVPSYERVLFWIWRDLFVSMLASNPGQRQAIPGMLQDISDAVGWQALPKIVVGGRMNTNSHEAGYGDDDFDVDDEDFEEGGMDSEEDTLTDDDEDAYDDYSEWSPFTPDHWPRSANFPVNDIRDIVQETLVSCFQILPSLELYNSTKRISTDPLGAQQSLLKTAESNAFASSDNFAAALNIFAHERSADTVLDLLKRGSHLLRPRDTAIHQVALRALSLKSTHKPQAMKICHDQLLVVARELRAALCVPFSRLYDPVRVTELDALLKQRSLSRASNVESWVSAVSTPASSMPNPVAFAAMMMGLPVPPPIAEGEIDGPEEINMIDLEKDRDPDLDDLREELRPQLKSRFESWQRTMQDVARSGNAFRQVIGELLALMPFLSDNEIIEEMLARLSDKPSKHYIYDALDSVHSFVKDELRKIQIQREKQNRKEAKAQRRTAQQQRVAQPSRSTQASSSNASAQAPSSSAPASSAPHSHAGPSMAHSRPPPGGFDDVD
ncbi:hypothetical protein BC834DRAFT_624032 [Gloeopeniophorella convolvens]|nr:hypothetical protein BC834DRAFT_624032 [Gloeopeniophorella convolvens]